MNIGDYLLGLIERIATKIIRAREPVMLEGEVTSAKPLKIRVRNYELEEEHLILDVRCTEQWIKIPKDGQNEHTHNIEASTELAKAGVTGQATENALGHKHQIKITTKAALPEICLWRELRVGDRVRIIRLEGGAIHWVTQRIEPNISNNSSQTGGSYATT